MAEQRNHCDQHGQKSQRQRDRGKGRIMAGMFGVFLQFV
jgi:hypothetical protein